MKRLAVFALLVGVACLVGCGDEPEAEGPRRMTPQDVFGPTVLGAYVEDLGSPDADKRLQACRSLGNMYKNGAGAVDALKQTAAKDRDSRVRKAAQDALAKIQQ